MNPWRLRLLHKAGLERDGDPLDPAVDLMVALHQPNVLRLGTGFEHLRTATELKVFDQGNRVAGSEDVAVGIFHDARDLGCVLFRPFVAACMSQITPKTCIVAKYLPDRNRRTP